MRNEFDDELNRDNIRKGRRGSNSKPDPSDEDYYLDDDYEDYQEPKHGGTNQTAGRGDMTKKAGERARGAYGSQPSAAGSQAMFRGQSSSGAAQNKSQGAPRPRQASGSSTGRNQVSSGNRNAQETSRPQPQAGRSQGTSRPQASSGSGQGTSRAQTAAGSAQGTARSRTASGSSQNAPRGQIVIGDGGTRQQPRMSVQDIQAKSAAASRSAAQTEKKRKIRRIIIMTVAEIFTLALIFSYAYVARLMGAIQRPDNFNENQVRNEIMSPEQKKHMTGYRTIAIFGVDSRDGNVNKGTNADVIMICNINRDTGEIRLVSVFRDTYLNTNEGNTYNKINSAYANGGAQQALVALNKNLDLDIREYVTFNWKSVADGINMLNGVDIDISKAEFRYINSFITETVKETGVPSVHLKSAGMNHLDGVQAVAYARLRKMDTDYARTERQRLVIQKTFDKAKKADLGLLNRILLMEVEQIGTNLTFSDFTELILDISKYHIGETGGFPFARGDMTIGKKGDCVIPQTLETNVSELHKLLFDKEDYEPSEMVKKISAKIAADSGMYKKGTSIDHVSTDEGDVPEKTTKATKEEKTTDAEESSSQGDFIEETDENGKPIKPADSSEGSTGATKETKPGETRPQETTSGATKPGETKPTPTGGVTETTTAAHGPGSNQTTAPETTSAGPGGPGETAASQNSNANGGASEVPVVSAPPVD
ncbi:LCP family protein [Clostridium sp. Marseille-P2415]|uniref:LCP family protein n=1 Tax=Clostridium sp. Marseille-P2415 TaxID=1805471 RepID=UPI0009883F6B|nr:LCP family protein [Clostridium sp. Marseille-P2415]